ncbi:MAG: hypothetical protein HYV90_04660 [Candidatus Woesebacteria bacterium]|nr:MAG: hypothetical protein HYV90_04660 [Candidatus Woesebacteria bacterium]
MQEKIYMSLADFADKIDELAREIESVNPEVKLAPVPLLFSQEYFKENTRRYNQTRVVVAYKERELARLIRKGLVEENNFRSGKG